MLTRRTPNSSRRRAPAKSRAKTPLGASTRRRALNEPRTDDTPIDARLIYIDETPYWTPIFRTENMIFSIGTVYLYDANQHTYIASTQPSYDLIALYPRATLTFEGQNLPDEQQDALFENIEDEARQYMEPGDYFDARTIDRLEKSLPQGDYKVIGGTGVSFEDESYEEQMEQLRETYTGNVRL